MNEFLKMDIFFFVTTVVVIAAGILSAHSLWRVGRVMKYLEHISEKASEESDDIREDLKEMHKDIRQGEGKLKSWFGFFRKSARRVSKDT